MQTVAAQNNPGSSQQQATPPNPQPLGPGRPNKPMGVKRTKPTNVLPTQGHNQPRRPPVRLSTIPAPRRGDKRPLIVLMGLKGRFKIYRRIRVRSKWPTPPNFVLTRSTSSRAEFGRSHTTLELIGRSRGREFLQVKRRCSIRWYVVYLHVTYLIRAIAGPPSGSLHGTF